MGDAAGRVAIALALALVANGCASSLSDVDWVLRFAEPADETRARAVEVCIVEGACPAAPVHCDDGARVRYRDTFAYGDGVVLSEGAMRPPQLAPGRYAFVGRARDETCRVIATGCTELDLPQPSAVVTLETAATLASDCCGATCDGGVCLTGDAGPACVDDDNPCTVPECDPSGACVLRLIDGGECLGGDVGPCNTSFCVGGACVPLPSHEGDLCADVDGNDCTESRCSEGACRSAIRPDSDWQPCAGPDLDPCRSSICGGGVCREAFPANLDAICREDGNPCTTSRCDAVGNCTDSVVRDGTTCGADSRNRCCGAQCVDIYTNTAHCGGCGLRCAAGRRCHHGDGARLTTCTCDAGIECPSGSGNCDRDRGLCFCSIAADCALDQSCEPTSLGMLCEYTGP